MERVKYVMEWKSVAHDGTPTHDNFVLAYASEYEYFFEARYKNGKWYMRNSGATIKRDEQHKCDTIWAKRNVEYWCELPMFDKEKQPYINQELNKIYNL